MVELRFRELDECQSPFNGRICGRTREEHGEDYTHFSHKFVPVRVLENYEEITKELDRIRRKGQQLQIEQTAIEGFCSMQNDLRLLVEQIKKGV